MLDPSKRTLTMLLAGAVAVLGIAILVGHQMGNRVLTQVEDSHGGTGIVAVTPAPTSSAPNYGPDWKRAQTLAAAVDPSFPDPRVPPVPIPTIPPTPKPTPTPNRPTPNPNIPIWDQTPIPSGPVTATPSPQPSEPSGAQSPRPSPSGTPPSSQPSPTATPETNRADSEARVPNSVR